MRAVRLHTATGPAGLSLDEVDVPDVGPGEALVHVHAAAITRDELDWPVDRLPAIPSYELSGVVAALGPDVHDVSVGNEVYALTGFDRDGVAAESAIVHVALLAPRPRTLDHVQSAAIPLAALSAWQGLFDHGRLEAGQRVLIHGAAGGVGHFAVQLARQRGAHVTATASTANLDAVRELGVEQVVDANAGFDDVVEAVDLVFDTAGGERLERSPAVIRPGGRLVSVAVEPPKDAAAARNVTPVYFIVEPNRDQLAAIADLADRGEVRPTVAAVFPLEDARTAFERSLDSARRGKIVLRIRN